jgi:phage regulator Rha-like protein
MSTQTEPKPETRLTLGPNAQSMTSREIADLTGKEHFNVLRDIRSMLDDLGDALKPEHISGKIGSNLNHDSNLNHVREEKDERGYTTCVYLNQELTFTLVTGYSAVLRNRVVKRWLELESKHAFNALAHIDPTRVTYIGSRHDLTRDGIYRAGCEIKLQGPKFVAKKYGVSLGFVDSIVRAGDRWLIDLERSLNKNEGVEKLIADALKSACNSSPTLKDQN